MKFKVGDKVRMVKKEDAAKCGWVGVIMGSYDADMYTVEFQDFAQADGGHSCDGMVPSGNGQWIHEENMELIKGEQEEPNGLFKEEPVRPLPTHESPTLSPVITFESQQQAEEYLAYWQEKLFLNDWIIKVKLVDQEELNNCQGSNDFVHSLMSSLIRISQHQEETPVTKECHEQTLVHELLHLKYNLMDADSESYESSFLSAEEHRLLEQLAKSLIMVKYNLSFDWFKNF